MPQLKLGSYFNFINITIILFTYSFIFSLFTSNVLDSLYLNLTVDSNINSGYWYGFLRHDVSAIKVSFIFQLATYFSKLPANGDTVMILI